MDPKEAVVYAIYQRCYEAEPSITRGNITYTTASEYSMLFVPQLSAFQYSWAKKSLRERSNKFLFSNSMQNSLLFYQYAI